MEHFRVKKRLWISARIIGERLHQVLRLTAGSANKYPVSLFTCLNMASSEANFSG
jgi:hypothetical protein